jgi:small subunit ribosomal protein S17
MDKTVVVETVRLKLDPVYKKYVRTRRRYKAHDEKNEFRVGDRSRSPSTGPSPRRSAGR